MSPVLVDYLGLILSGNTTPAPGDIIRRGLTGGWEWFGAGAANSILTIDQSSLLPVWMPRLVSALPTASIYYQGQVITLQGASGVADIAYICLKGASGTYSWKQLATG